MENAYFYSSVDETKQNRRVLNYLKSYAEQQSQQVYVINSALGSNYKYDYSDALVILIPKKKIVIVALVDTLEYLKKGGRISKTVAFAGTVLNIKTRKFI